MILIAMAYVLGLVLVGGGAVVGSKTREAYKNYNWRKETAAFHAYCESIKAGAAR